MQCPLVLASTGAIARYPMGRKPAFATLLNTFADFTTQSSSLLANPLSSWALNLSMLRDDELQDWLEFIESVKGQGTLFTFADPWDNLLTYTEEIENAAWVTAANTYIGKNYLLWSEDLSNAVWTKTAVGVAVPVVTTNISSPLAPDGSQTADQIAFPSTAAAQSSTVAQNIAAAIPQIASQTFAFSVFLRASAAVSIQIEIQNQAGSVIATLAASLSNSAWGRFTVTGTMGVSDTAVNVLIYQTASQSAKTVFSWGEQLNFGGGAEEYTKTTTAAVALLISDPFWQAAPSADAGASFSLNSVFSKRARQLVMTLNGTSALQQNIAIAPGGSGNYRSQGLQFAASFYAKHPSFGGPPMSLTVKDGLGIESFSSAALTILSTWQRYSIAGQFSSSNRAPSTVLSMAVSGGTGICHIFGSQLELSGAVSRYKHNVATGGVHLNCRISDLANHSVDGFDLNTLQEVIIQEYAG